MRRMKSNRIRITTAQQEKIAVALPYNPTYEIYTHVSKKSIGKIVNPLDNLQMGGGDK